MSGFTPPNWNTGYSGNPPGLFRNRNPSPLHEAVSSNLLGCSGPRLPSIGNASTPVAVPSRQGTNEQMSLLPPTAPRWLPEGERNEANTSPFQRLSRSRTPSMPSLPAHLRHTGLGNAGYSGFAESSAATTSRYVPPGPNHCAPAGRRNATGLPAPASNSPVDIQLDFDTCIVCGSDNGPWRRGPLGVSIGFRLCNSCGHIRGSSLEADNYEHAVTLLENLRVSRLARVRRRPGSNEVSDLLQRLQRLPARTLRLARAKFPSDAPGSSHNDHDMELSFDRSAPSTSMLSISYSSRGHEMPTAAEDTYTSNRLRRISGLEPLDLHSNTTVASMPGHLDTRLSTAPPLRRRASLLDLAPPSPTFDMSEAVQPTLKVNQRSLGSGLLNSVTHFGGARAPAGLLPLQQPFGSGRMTTDPSAYALNSYRGPSTAVGLSGGSSSSFGDNNLLPPLQLPPLTTSSLNPLPSLGTTGPYLGISPRARATHSSSRLPQLPFRGRGRGFSESSGYPPI